MSKEQNKKSESIFDEEVWDEAAEMMERNQKGYLPDSKKDKGPKGNDNDEPSVLDRIKDFFK